MVKEVVLHKCEICEMVFPNQEYAIAHEAQCVKKETEIYHRIDGVTINTIYRLECRKCKRFFNINLDGEVVAPTALSGNVEYVCEFCHESALIDEVEMEAFYQ